ncbi:nuclease-related domain-containing protein [Nocardia cyriacigeorgica]|uniref:nuclease-related domain-containing protein n=1 Tax=Nocardia cyriacigeorgica TaxID=135487 RepID=UPI002453C9A9|nr:nuclease-related domain-containing protein [Nocardia cyriacigeorgica]
MLIINGGREAMPNSERRVLDCLADPALPGVVVSGLFLADRRGRGRETDAVVLTPDAVAVLEVKGLTVNVAAGGRVVLHTSANARWWAEGHDGDPVHVAPGDNSPFDQLGGRVFDLKSALASVPGGPPYISGVVVAVPPAGAELRVAHSGPLPHGCSVIAADHLDGGELRPWVAGLRRKRGHAPVFTAGRAAAALAALGVRPPSEAEMNAAGFRSDPNAAAPVAAAAGPSAPNPGPGPSAAAPDPSTLPPLPGPGSSWHPTGVRRRPGRGTGVGAGRALGLAAMAGLAVVVVASVAAIVLGTDTADTDTGPGTTFPAVTEPARPGPATTTPTTVPAITTPYTPPPPPKACYPFQPC